VQKSGSAGFEKFKKKLVAARPCLEDERSRSLVFRFQPPRGAFAELSLDGDDGGYPGRGRWQWLPNVVIEPIVG